MAPCLCCCHCLSALNAKHRSEGDGLLDDRAPGTLAVLLLEAGSGRDQPVRAELLGKCSLAGCFAAPLVRDELSEVAASDALRVVPVTVHVALVEVPRLLTTELIVETAEIVAREPVSIQLPALTLQQS